MRRAWLAVASISVSSVWLAGCSSLLTEGSAAGAGVGGAAVANAITSNAAVTTGIGLGAQAVASAAVQALEKTVHHAEQQRIASAAGKLPVGGSSPWLVDHDIPIEANEHGEVAVVRLIGSDAAGLSCKEIVFSVDQVRKKQPARRFYTASVCQTDGTWRWATAEPATSRWGALQ
ncbi:MAG: hypothetical protein ACRYGI_11290 [Janthinobacterium lividum]